MKTSNYEYRQILLENQKALEQAIINIEMIMAQDSAKMTFDYIDKLSRSQLNNAGENKEEIFKIVCCELISYLDLMKKALYEGSSLTNDEWQFLCDYRTVFNEVASDEAIKNASSRMQVYVKEYCNNYLTGSLQGIKEKLDDVRVDIANTIKAYVNSKEAERDKRYEEILKIEADNVSNELVARFNVDKRLLYSIQHNIMKYDIENEKDESKAQKKLTYLLRWKRYICEYQKINVFSNSYFIEDDDILYKEYRKFIPAKIGVYAPKYSVFWVDCLMFEAYNTTQIGESSGNNRLKISSNYIKDVLCDKYGMISEKLLKDIKSEIKRNTRRFNNTNEKVAIAIVSTAIITAATGGAASAFAPAIAVALVGESFVGLSGAALTSASLAAIGGGSLAAGGLGMAGGVTAITSGGAILGLLSGASSSVIASVLFDGVSLQSCIKLLTLNNIMRTVSSLSDESSNINAICDNYIRSNKKYLEFVNENITDLDQAQDKEDKLASTERKQKLGEYKKLKKNIEKNISYLEKAKKYLLEDTKKAKEKKDKTKKK